MEKMPLAQSKILAYLEIRGVKRRSECIQEGDKDLPSTRIPLPGGPGSREGPQTNHSGAIRTAGLQRPFSLLLSAVQKMRKEIHAAPHERFYEHCVPSPFELAKIRFFVS